MADLTPNIELLDKIIAQIEAHPELWYQDTWMEETDCGTAHCVAGWAAALTRPGPLVLISPWEAVDEDGRLFNWEDYGREVLGLTTGQAQLMFSVSTTLPQIKAMRDSLAADSTRGLWYIYIGT